MKVHKKNILITSAVFTIVLLFTGAVKAADFNFLIGTWTLTITGKQFGEPFESHPTWVFTEASETAAIGNNIKDNDLLVTWDSTRGQYRQQNPGSDLIYYFSAFNNKIIGEIKDTSFNSIFSDMTFEGVKDVSNEPEVNTYFYDNDSDGYGDPNASYDAASQPAGYVTDNTDCNDYDSSIHPGATEIEGDGIDQDCNGKDQSIQENIEAFVSRFYEVVLGRATEAGGLNYWTNSLMNKTRAGADVAREFIFSQEFTNKQLDNSSYVDVLYSAFFNRQPDSGHAYWLGRLDNGESRDTVLGGFIWSQEFSNLCQTYSIDAVN